MVISALVIWGHVDFTKATVAPENLENFGPFLAGTRIQSFFFNIETIEVDGSPLGTVTTIHGYEKGALPFISNGGQLVYTPKGIRVNVLYGHVAMGFEIFGGAGLAFAAEAGNSFEFELESLIISSSVKNTNEVLVIFDGQQFFMTPGERTQIVAIDIMPEIEPYHFSQDMERLTPVIIFGSAHLDVRTIEISSLRFEGFTIKRVDDGRNLAAIDTLNDDKFPDLMVLFEKISDLVYKPFGYPSLRGNLSDGTIINGRYNILLKSWTNHSPHQEDVRSLREVR
jgi:hypothetical protein